MTGNFIEVGYYQICKHNQFSCGDVFYSKKIGEDRIISVLADGLGSSIKANVLATLTSTMAMQYISNDINIKKAARIIMDSLPICKYRKIAYSTFTIVDARRDGQVAIIEYDNPGFALFRGNKQVEVNKRPVVLNRPEDRKVVLHYSRFKCKTDDRILIYSDGVTQSGLGSEKYPIGWTGKEVVRFSTETINEHQKLSAGILARIITRRSLANDAYRARDDISCAVVYYRSPRECMVFTGPPFNKDQDKLLVKRAVEFAGKKIICGGTTAQILARELGKKLIAGTKTITPGIPPISELDGFELVTEGSMTLAQTIRLLENHDNCELTDTDGASQLVNQLLDSDIIRFVVGTKINEAYQDPYFAEELDIRANLIRRIKYFLEKKFLKKVSVEYV